MLVVPPLYRCRALYAPPEAAELAPVNVNTLKLVTFCLLHCKVIKKIDYLDKNKHLCFLHFILILLAIEDIWDNLGKTITQKLHLATIIFKGCLIVEHIL